MQHWGLRRLAFQRTVAVISIFLFFFASTVSADQLALPSDDIEAPQIHHDVLSEPFRIGDPQEITATVTDNAGVKSVLLYFRQIGQENYQRMEMIREGRSELYRAQLTEHDVNSPGIEYYIQATDLTGNKLLHGFAFSPMIVNVVDEEGESTGIVSTSTDIDSSEAKEGSGSYKWLWVTLGVIAVGALASSGGGGGDDPPPRKTDTAGFTITTPLPGK